jgi:signal peptidase I
MTPGDQFTGRVLQIGGKSGRCDRGLPSESATVFFSGCRVRGRMAATKRRPWLAGLLSWFAPGLGQLYNGRPLRGALFYVSFWLVFVIAYELLLHWDGAPWNVVLPMSLLIGSIIAIAVDAFRDARRKRNTSPFGPWYVHVLAALVITLVVSPLGIKALRASIGQTFSVASGGMADTIPVGDHILVDTAAFGLHSPWARRSSDPPRPERNQVVAFRSSTDPSLYSVQRIVGLPGEDIQIRDKRLLVNGVLALEPFVVHVDPQTYPGPTIELQNPKIVLRDNFGPYRVPEGMYFGLGDNRDNSFDSRFQGPIPAENIVGVVRRIYWSWDSQERKIRWSRIGRSVS